jgi:hypothetical protein
LLLLQLQQYLMLFLQHGLHPPAVPHASSSSLQSHAHATQPQQLLIAHVCNANHTVLLQRLRKSWTTFAVLYAIPGWALHN